jgi:hypothetical protein
MKQLLSQSGGTAVALVAALALSGSARAAEAQALVGNWKLISWQVVTGNEAQDVFGPHPRGYLILTGEGRAMALTTAEGRKSGETDAERSALHRSMLAYTGRCRIDGSDFITTVDVSWNESWNGSEQRRHYRIEGDKLFIDSAPAQSITSAGKTDYRRIVWERER